MTIQRDDDEEVKDLFIKDLKTMYDLALQTDITGYFIVVSCDHQGRDQFNAHMSSNYGLLLGLCDLVIHHIKNQMSANLYDDMEDVDPGVDDSDNSNNNKTIN